MEASPLTASVSGKSARTSQRNRQMLPRRIRYFNGIHALVRLHALLGRFCKTVLNLNLILPLITAYIGASEGAYYHGLSSRHLVLLSEGAAKKHLSHSLGSTPQALPLLPSPQSQKSPDLHITGAQCRYQAYN